MLFDRKLHQVAERYQHDKEDKYLRLEQQIKQAVKIADDYQHEVHNLTKHIEKIEREKITLEDLVKANFAQLKELKHEKTLRDNQLALTEQLKGMSQLFGALQQFVSPDSAEEAKQRRRGSSSGSNASRSITRRSG